LTLGGENTRGALRTGELSYSRADGDHRLTIRFLGPDGSEYPIWYEVSGNLTEIMRDRADAFVLPGILLAIRLGMDLDITCPISDRLASNLPDIALVLSTGFGRPCPRVTHAETLSAELVPPAAGAVTGMSCGVDSFFTLKEYYFEERYRSRKITHLLHNEIGANTTLKKHQQSLNNAKAVADELGIELVTVKSNMGDVLDSEFQASYVSRNASVSYLLGNVASCFYHSSALAYEEIGVFPTYDASYTEPILLQLARTPNMDMISSGAATLRLHKVFSIQAMDVAKRYLDVCVDHAHTGPKINCSKCWKCCRTLLTLEGLGKLEDFEAVFDLDTYRAERPRLLALAKTSKRPNDGDAYNCAAAKGYKAPLHWTLFYYGMRIVKKLKRMSGMT